MLSGMHRRHHQRCSFVIYRDILKALTGSYLRAQLVLLLRYIAIYRGPVLTMENPDISYVLCLTIYLMSYDLCLMSHLMSDVICSDGFGLCLAFRA